MEYRRPQSYEERFLILSSKLERMLFRVAMVGFAGIVISQIVLSVPEIRSVLSAADRLEGQQISSDKTDSGTSTAEKEITIRSLTDKPITAWVKINGVPVAQILPNGVRIKVKKNEIVEIDTSSLEGIYRFEIDHNDPSITYPTPGILVESSQTHAAVLKPILVQD
jgi:hypothetical protein